MLDSAKTTQDFQSVSNAFERIGDAEKTQWLPYYYAALAQTRIGWLDKSVDKDQLAIKINALCDKAEALDKNADLYTIRNMVATQQMMVDPSTRWQTYGQQASEALQKGMEMDPNNPRLYYLQGQSVFNTPPAYGGGKDKAKPIFEKAIELFKKESPKPLYPSWGLDQAQVMLAQCK
jgi:tetratricopeptide (TPR) repeat protein